MNYLIVSRDSYDKMTNTSFVESLFGITPKFLQWMNFAAIHEEDNSFTILKDLLDEDQSNSILENYLSNLEIINSI